MRPGITRSGERAGSAGGIPGVTGTGSRGMVERRRRYVHDLLASLGEADLAGIRRELGSADFPTRPALSGLTVDTEGLRRRLVQGRQLLERETPNGVTDVDRLAADELLALEAVIIALGRPALLIRDGTFDPPLAPWSDRLEPHRESIQTSFKGVGRLEVVGHPTFDWVGTGFLVGSREVLTNRHVVREFAQKIGGQWEIDDGLEVRIDFGEEFGSGLEDERPVARVVGAHTFEDAALLQLADEVDETEPLPLDGGDHLTDQNFVYVVGYPAADARRNDPADVQAVFNGIFGVKRLQPGVVTSVNGFERFTHDCSTLGGNSGSCVVDLSTGVVVGLHVGGRYAEANFAIPAKTLATSKKLIDAGARIV